MKIILDKNLDTKRELEVDRVAERPLTNRMTANRSGLTVAGVPDLSGFTETSFATLDVEGYDGQELLPVGSYDHVEDLSLTYEDEGKQYYVNLVLAGDGSAE